MVNIEKYLINRGSTSANKEQTPKKRWTEKKPTVHLRIIGSFAYKKIILMPIGSPNK